MILQTSAGGINVGHRIRDVTEVTTPRVSLAVPVVRQLQLRFVITRSREERQRVAPRGDFSLRQQFEAEGVTVEPQ